MESISNSETYKILLIEDNPDYCQSIHDQLRYDKTTEFILQNTDRVTSGIQMLKDEEFDAVLLDFLLPDVQGLEALERIVNFKHDLPVIILTAVGDERLASTALQKGAEDYLIKGEFDTSLLIRSIHYAIKCKEAALTVRKIEEKYRTLFETTMEGIITSDFEGRILLANPAAATILGYESIDELKKSRMTDHYTDSKQRKNIIRELKLKGHLNNIEIYGKKKDGTKIVALTSLMAHNDNKGNLLKIEGVFRDITARKKSEETLQQKTHELEERVKKLNCLYGLSQLMGDSRRSSEDVLNQVLYVIPQAWQYPKSTYVRIELNDKIFKTKNYKETPWSQSSDIIISGQRAGVLEVGYLKEMPVIFEGPFLKEERDLIDALARQIATFQQRIDADEELRREEARYWQLVNNLSDIIFTLTPNGIITSINPSFEKLTGYSRDEFIGKAFLNLIHPDDLSLVISGFESLSKEGKPLNIDVRLKTKSGSELIVEGKLTPHIEAGELIGYFGVTHDITEHKNMIDALKESEDRFRVLSNSTFEMSAIHDQGTIIDINNQLLIAFGYTREEIIGINFFNLITPDTRPIAMKYAREGYEEPFEIVGLRKDKTTFPLQTQARLIPYKGRIVSVIAGRDLSERKQTEKALRDSEERLRIFMDSATVSFSLWDSELNLVDTNKKSLELFHPPETKKEDIIGRSMFELAPDLEKTGRYKTYLEVIKSGIPFKTDDLVIHPEYGNFHLSLEVFKVGNGIGVIAMDVTKQILAEKDIKEANKRFEHILASNPAIIYSAEPKGENQTTYMSKNVIRITGYKPKDFIRKPSFWVKKLHPKDRTKVKDTFKREISEKGYFRGVYRFQHKDGTYRWMVEEARLITDTQGNPQEIIGYWSDITEQKNIEKEFQRSEQKYQTLIANMVDILVETNSDAMITFISPQVTNILAYSPEELVGKCCLDFVHPKDLESVVNTLTNTEDLILEVRLKHKNGHFVPFSILGRSVQVDGTSKLVGVLRDITEQKKADERLHRERQNFYKILNSTDDAIYIINSQHEVEFINTATEKEFGPVKGKKCYEYFNEFSEACSWCTLEKVINGETIRRERTLERNQKTYDMIDTPYISPNGKISSLAILRDVTDRKKAEEALKESEEKYRSFIENFQGIAYQGYEDFSVGFFLGKVEEITGYSAENFLLGRVVFDQLIHPEDIQWITEDIEKFMSSSQRATKREYRIIDKNSSMHWVQETILKFYDEKQEKHGVYGTFQDITERKKIENGLKLSEEKYRTLFESAPNLIVLFNSSGVIIDCNKAIVQVLGISKEEILGKNFMETGLVIEEDKAEYLEIFADAIKGIKKGPIEARCIDLEGNIRYFELYTRLFQKDDITQVIQVINHDITERKQAEVNLQKSEKKYRELISNLADTVVEVDSKGNFTYLSPQCIDLLGYTAEEVIGKNSFEFVHPNDLEIIMEAFENALQGEYVHDVEYRGKHKTGHTVWLSASGRMVKEGDDLKLVMIAKNINDRKETEQALRESEERFRQLVETSPDGIVLTDLLGNIVFINKKGAMILGYKAEHDLITKNIFELIAIEDQERALRAIKRTFKTGEGKTLEYNFIKRGGMDIPIEMNTTLIKNTAESAVYFLAILRDITERKEVQKQLEESEVKYRTILETMKEGYYEADLKGNITFFNNSLCNLLGATSNDLKGKNYREFCDVTTAQRVFETFNDVFKTRKSIKAYNWNFTQKDGTKRVIEMSISLHKNFEGKIVGFFGIAIDITDRKAIEEALIQSKERYRILFEEAPISLWEEDYSEVKQYLDYLKEERKIEDLQEYFDSHPEEVLKLNEKIKVLDINNATLQLFGAENKDQFITNVDSILNPEYFSVFKKMVPSFVKGEKFEGEYRGYRFNKDPIQVFVQSHIAPGYEKTCSRVLTSIIDVTERRKIERALIQSEERLRSFMDSANESFYLFDSDLNIVDLNANAQEVLRINKNNLIGRNIVDLNPKLKDTDRINTFLEVIKTGKPFIEHDIGFLPKYGEKNNLIRAFKVGDGLGIISADITEQIQTQEALKRSEERFRKIFEEGPLGMALIKPNLSYIGINEAFCKMLDYNKQELMKVTFLHITHPDDREKDKENIARLLRGEIARYQTEKRYIKKNGETFWASTTKSLLRDDLGNPLHIITMTEDINQRKRVEEKMKKQLMKFNIKDRSLYLVPESYPSVSKQVFVDLIQLGYSGFAISRVPRKEFKRDFNIDFDFLWLSEVEGSDTIPPSPNKIEETLEKLPSKSIIWLDRLDYLISKNGFKKTLQSVFKLREIAYLNDLVVILSVDPETIPKHYFSALKKETKSVEPRFLVKVPDDFLEVLRIIYRQNNIGVKPSFTDIGNKLEISKPTARKRIKELVATGYLDEKRSGNRKILELTEKGLLLFRKENVS